MISLVSSSAYANEWFSYGSGLNDDVFALRTYNGTVVAGGKFTNSGNSTLNRIGFWNGSRWMPLGSGFNDNVNALEVFNGNLVAGGKFNNSGGTPLNRIAMWNGTAWSPMGSGLLGEVKAMTVFQGKLIIGGVFSSIGGNPANNVAVWDGIQWSELSTGLDNTVYSLTVHNGVLYAGGNFLGKVAKWNGTSWSVVGGGLDNIVRALASYNGDLIAGGEFNEKITLWNGSNWQKLNEGVDDDVYALTVHKGDLIVGGQFIHAPQAGDNGTDLELNRIGRWDGNAWSKISDGMKDDVYTLSSHNEENIVAGGKFKRAGSTKAHHIAYTEKTGIISGVVRYINGQLVTGGVVKAVRLDGMDKKVIVSDSALVQNNGTYALLKVPQTAHRLIIFPNDELEDCVPTYYPSTIFWNLAPTITPDSIVSNVNITVFSMSGSGPGKIKGKVKLNYNPPFISDNRGTDEDTLEYRGGSIVYAKVGTTFKGFSVTGSDEEYEIPSLSQGLYEIIVSRMGYVPEGRVVNFSFSQGFILDSVDFTIDTLDVVLTIENNNILPGTYKLYQNYPNPFNPSTNIKYDISSASTVKLTIHDMLGRKTGELVNEFQQAGTYNVSWKPGNLTSGLYFYTLEILSPEGTNFIETRKMLLIK